MTERRPSRITGRDSRARVLVDGRPRCPARPQGMFSRQLRLGASIDSDHIGASYEGGVLTLSLPVAARAKPPRVEIRSGGKLTPGAQYRTASGQRKVRHLRRR
jgi:Hsp20/alpha crystallin family